MQRAILNEYRPMNTIRTMNFILYLIEHIDPGILFEQNFNDLRLSVVAGEQERRPAVL